MRQWPSVLVIAVAVLVVVAILALGQEAVRA